MMELMDDDPVDRQKDFIDMRRYIFKPRSSLLVNCLRWLAIILIVIVGAYNFELMKHYVLFIALAALVLLLCRR